MTDPLQDSIARFTRGDAARATRLRENLRTILDRTTDPHLRAVIQRTLDGGPPATRVVLAGAEGDERSTILWMAPYYENNAVAGVHMTILPSGA